jgi:hypothetical protein
VSEQAAELRDSKTSKAKIREWLKEEHAIAFRRVDMDKVIDEALSDSDA